MRTKRFDEVFREWHSRKLTHSIRTKTAEKYGGKIPTRSMCQTKKYNRLLTQVPPHKDVHDRWNCTIWRRTVDACTDPGAGAAPGVRLEFLAHLV
jgi:hypothetical protein